MDHDFRDRVVLVTGAGAGIGLALCQAFAGAGAHVVLNDIDAHRAEAAAARLNEALGTAQVAPLPFDVADPDAVQRAVQGVSDRMGRLDVAVANAGVTHYGAFMDFSPHAFEQLIGVNLRGTFFTAQAAARAMIAHPANDGRLLLMSSTTGLRAMPNLGAYGMTKAALRHLARSIALEVGRYGITANALCPGAILTERTRADDPDHERHWSRLNPNGRDGYVADVVAAALFLAAPAARHITGQTLVIDGGWTVQGPLLPDQPEAEAAG